MKNRSSRLAKKGSGSHARTLVTLVYLFINKFHLNCGIPLYLYYRLVYLLFPSLNRYPGYYDNTYPYSYSRKYWHLLAARLAFVFVFQFIVYAITSFIAWVVPDTSAELQFKMEREKQMIKSVFHDHEDDSEADDEDDDVQFEDAKQEIDTEE